MDRYKVVLCSPTLCSSYQKASAKELFQMKIYKHLKYSVQSLKALRTLKVITGEGRFHRKYVQFQLILTVTNTDRWCRKPVNPLDDTLTFSTQSGKLVWMIVCCGQSKRRCFLIDTIAHRLIRPSCLDCFHASVHVHHAWFKLCRPNERQKLLAKCKRRNAFQVPRPMPSSIPPRAEAAANPFRLDIRHLLENGGVCVFGGWCSWWATNNKGILLPQGCSANCSKTSGTLESTLMNAHARKGVGLKQLEPT